MKRVIALVAILISGSACGGPAPGPSRLAGDWDYERMLGAAPNGGFEARRRFGFAHFDGPSATGAWLKRRSGDPLETIASVELTGDTLVLSLGGDRSIRGVVSGDTITGQILQAGKAIDRVWLTRRTSPPVWEPPYPLWPGPVSEPTFKVTIDPADADESPRRRDAHELRRAARRRRTIRGRHRTHAVPAHGSGGGRILGLARLHLCEAGRPRPRRIRWRARHERDAGAGRLRRRRVGRGAARQQRQGRHDRPVQPGPLRVVRRDRTTAAPGDDRARRGDRRSAAPRALHRHGVLADDHSVAVSHGCERDDVGHQQRGRSARLQPSARHRKRGARRLPAPEVLERLVRSSAGRRLLARLVDRAASRSRQGAGARHRRLVRRRPRHDSELCGDVRACRTIRCCAS